MTELQRILAANTDLEQRAREQGITLWADGDLTIGSNAPEEIGFIIGENRACAGVTVEATVLFRYDPDTSKIVSIEVLL